MKKKISFCVTVMMLLLCCFPKLALSVCQQHNAQVISPDPSLDVKDYNVNIALQRNEVFVYDELGNQYVRGIYGKFTKDRGMSELPKTLLPSEVPVRFSLYIRGVEEGVVFLPKIIFECRTGYSPAKLTIKNVLISE